MTIFVYTCRKPTAVSTFPNLVSKRFRRRNSSDFRWTPTWRPSRWRRRPRPATTSRQKSKKLSRPSLKIRFSSKDSSESFVCCKTFHLMWNRSFVLFVFDSFVTASGWRKKPFQLVFGFYLRNMTLFLIMAHTRAHLVLACFWFTLTLERVNDINRYLS